MKELKSARSGTLIVLVMLFHILLVSGCSHQVYQNGILDYSTDKGHSADISKRDLHDFSASIKPVNSQAESYYKMAIHFQKHRKHNLAIAELKNALRIDPGFAKALNAMGISYDNLRFYDRAILCYRKALTLDPGFDDAYNNLGYSYLLSNDLNSAIGAFQKAIGLDGRNPRYRNNLGLAYVMSGQNDKAYEQFKIVKDETGAEEKMAMLLYRLGKDKSQQYPAQKSGSALTTIQSGDDDPAVSISRNQNTEPGPVLKSSLDSQNLQDPEIVDGTNEAVKSSNTRMIIEETILPDKHPEHKADPTPETEVEQPTALISKAEPVNQELETEMWPLNDSSESDEPIYFLSAISPSSEIGPEKKDHTETENAIELPTEQKEERGEPFVVAAAPLSVVRQPEVKTKQLKPRQGENQVKRNSKLIPKKEDSNANPKPYNTNLGIRIEVANGNGKNGAAGRLGKYLNEKGYKVLKVTNARCFDHTTSKIFYCDVRIEDVYKLIQAIPIDGGRRKLIKVNHLGKRIKIIVGHDLVERNL